MIRQGRYKYVRFRDCEPLSFDLEEDPGEQHNLIGVATGEAVEAQHWLAALAQRTMDFEAAERERIEGDQLLQSQYALQLESSLGNQYLMPGGALVEADDTLYDPVVLSQKPADLFADWPGDE